MINLQAVLYFPLIPASSCFAGCIKALKSRDSIYQHENACQAFPLRKFPHLIANTVKGFHVFFVDSLYVKVLLIYCKI